MVCSGTFFVSSVFDASIQRDELISRLRQIGKQFQNGPIEATVNLAADMLSADAHFIVSISRSLSVIKDGD